MAEKRFLVICLLLFHAAMAVGDDINALTPLKVHVSDLTNICVAELIPSFNKVLFQYAFASLNSDPNPEFTGYDKFIATQMAAFENAKTTFNAKVTSVKSTTRTYLQKWLIWFAYKHIEYFYSKKTSGLKTFAKVTEAETMDTSGTVKTIKFVMSSDTIEALFSHLTTELAAKLAVLPTDLVAKLDVLLTDFAAKPGVLPTDIAAKLDVLLTDHVVKPAVLPTDLAAELAVLLTLKMILWTEYANLLNEVYIKNLDQDTSEWALEFLSVFVPFFPASAVYRIFLRFPQDTVVYSDIGTAANFFAIDEVYQTRESNSALSYVLLFDSFYFTGNDPGFDYDMVAAFSGFSGTTHSAKFLSWLNANGDNGEYRKAKTGIYYIYTYLSIKGAGATHVFANNAAEKDVANAILKFMLEGTGTVCYKNLTGPTPDCTLEEILPLVSFTKRYCHMIELLGPLVDGGAAGWATTNTEKIKNLKIWEKYVGMDKITDTTVKSVCEAARAKNNHEVILTEIRDAVKALIVEKEKTVTETGFYSKKFYNVIINRRKIARTIVTTTVVEKVISNLRKTDGVDQMINSFKQILEQKEDDEVYQVVIYHLVLSVISNIFSHIKKDSNNGQDAPCDPSTNDITKFNCNEKKFAEDLIGFMANHAANSIAGGMKKPSTDGLRNYLQTTLRMHGIANKAYFTSVLANEYRPFDAYIFTFNNIPENEQTAYTKLFTDQTILPPSFTLKKLIETQPLIAMRMDSFEMFKNYVGIFKHYMWEQNIGKSLTVVSKPHDKTFLTLFNQVYKFLAQIRFLSTDIESDPIAEILTFCLNCLKAREAQPRPLDQKETEPCVLSYAEQIEVTYLLIGFFMKKSADRFVDDLAATITEISKFLPAHLDNFLKLIYYEPIMAEMWSNYCQIGENHEADIFKTKPICISINIVAKTKNCVGIPGINAATANAHQLHENAILWLTTCINHEITYLEGTKTNADVTSLTYTYVAFAALFHLDAHNGIFEVLLDEARIDGYIEIAKANYPKDGANLKTLLKTGGTPDPDADAGLVKLAEDYQVYKKFERCIAIDLPELEDDKIPVIAAVKNDYAKFLRLRFQKSFFNGEESAFAVELWKLYSEKPNIAKIDGNVVVEFVEALLKYGDQLDHYEKMAELLIRSGKALSVVHMSTRGRNIVEEAFYAQIDGIEPGQSLDARKFIISAWDTLQLTIIAKTIQLQEKIADSELSELDSNEFLPNTSEEAIHKIEEEGANGTVVDVITPILTKKVEQLIEDTVGGEKENVISFGITNQMGSTSLKKTSITDLNSNVHSIGSFDEAMRTRIMGSTIITAQEIYHEGETFYDHFTQREELDESELVEEEEVYFTATIQIKAKLSKDCREITKENWMNCVGNSAPKEMMHENGMSPKSGELKLEEAFMVLQKAGIKFGEVNPEDMKKFALLVDM